MSKVQTVAVLGASPKPDRYSNKAMRMLKVHGHRAIPVNPVEQEIEGFAVVPDLGAIAGTVDTLTVYVNPDRSLPLADDMIRLRPSRVILNPGTESEALEKKLRDAGSPVLKACTLVLLRTGQF